MSSLDRSLGFRVASSDGYIGTVEEVVYGAENRLGALVIATGLSERPFVLVGAEEVLHCSESASALILSPSWRTGALELSNEGRLVAA
jgi:hypothetical protein